MMRERMFSTTLSSGSSSSSRCSSKYFRSGLALGRKQTDRRARVHVVPGEAFDELIGVADRREASILVEVVPAEPVAELPTQECRAGRDLLRDAVIELELVHAVRMCRDAEQVVPLVERAMHLHQRDVLPARTKGARQRRGADDLEGGLLIVAGAVGERPDATPVVDQEVQEPRVVAPAGGDHNRPLLPRQPRVHELSQETEHVLFRRGTREHGRRGVRQFEDVESTVGHPELRAVAQEAHVAHGREAEGAEPEVEVVGEPFGVDLGVCPVDDVADPVAGAPRADVVEDGTRRQPVGLVGDVRRPGCHHRSWTVRGGAAEKSSLLSRRHSPSGSFPLTFGMKAYPGRGS